VLSYESFREYLAKVPSSVRVIFSGFCEPWLNSECSQMVLHAHQKGHPIEVYTTLVGMQAPEVDLLEAIPFGRFVVHLPSADGRERIEVDDDYLSLLARVAESSVAVSEYSFNSQAPHPKVAAILRGVPLEARQGYVHDRAGNAPGQHSLSCRWNGAIWCRKLSVENSEIVLLPDGEVALCCNDFGLRHLRNLGRCV
jgi:hypothetical protein